jgi:hypothetical protein
VLPAPLATRLPAARFVLDAISVSILAAQLWLQIARGVLARGYAVLVAVPAVWLRPRSGNISR